MVRLKKTRTLLGTDLKITDSENGADLQISPTGDLSTISAQYNIGQAILSRIRTRKGELRELGHELLGSRLYEFVGEPNNERTREAMKAVLRETLSEEPRIQEITRMEVLPNNSHSDRVDISVSVLPIGEEVPLNVVIPFYLEVA